MWRSLVLLPFLIAPAYAQDKQVTLSLSIQEAQAVLNQVGNGPWKDVNPLMQKMIAQINQQMQPPPPPPPPSTPPTPPPEEAPK